MSLEWVKYYIYMVTNDEKVLNKIFIYFISPRVHVVAWYEIT